MTVSASYNVSVTCDDDVNVGQGHNLRKYELCFVEVRLKLKFYFITTSLLSTNTCYHVITV